MGAGRDLRSELTIDWSHRLMVDRNSCCAIPSQIKTEYEEVLAPEKECHQQKCEMWQLRRLSFSKNIRIAQRSLPTEVES